MSSNPNSHSDPIPIAGTARPRGNSIGSDSSSPPLSPSHSPSSNTSGSLPTPLASSARLPLSPTTPTSPIISFLSGYGPPKTPFGPPVVVDDTDSQDMKPGSHHRRMSTSWIPVRFAQQTQNRPPVTEAQQERGAGILRRLSISTPLTGKPNLPVPPAKQDGGTRPGPRPTSPRSPRRAATLSAGTAKQPRAPSPMGERMLKGHYDGF